MSYQIGNAALGVTFVGDLGSLQRSLDQAGGAVDQFGRRGTSAMRGVASEATRADDAMSRLANGIKGAFIGGSVAVGLIGLKNQVVAATQAVVDAQVQLDRWRNGFAFGAGGMAQGAREFAFVREEVNRLGLDLGSTAAQYMKMVAASRGSALAGAQTREVFKAIAEASVVMGMNAEQNERAFMAVTQMMSKGKVMAEELRGQLSEHLPGSFAIAARAMGVTEVELNKLMETGQVFSADFLPKFAAQLRKELAGSVEQSSLSMQANLNRLSTSWLNFKQQFAQSGAGDFLSDQIKVLSGDLKVLGDVMEASRQRGEGFWMTLANTAGAAIGRATFGALELAANTANGAVFGLREQVRLMPDNLRSTGEQFVLTGQKIQQAQQEYDALTLRLAQAPDNIYIKSELGNLARYIARLKEAQEEQRKLLGGDAGGGITGAVASGDVALARAQRAQYDKQASARDALLKRYATPTEKLNEELRAQKDLLGDLFTPDVEARIRAHFIKPAGEGGAAARSLADDFSRLKERLQTDLAGGAAQAQAAQQGLNSAQADFLKLAASPVWGNLSNDQRADLALLYERRIAQEQLTDGFKASAAAAEALARAEDAHIKTYTDTAGKAASRLEELRAEAAAMAYAEQHHVSLAVAIEETAMARLREAQAAEMAKGTGMNDSVVLALQQEIDARRQIIAALAGKELREAGQKLREDEAAEWKRTWDQISQSFTDALMEGGKSVAEYLKGLFRTMVLRPILAPIGTGLASLIMPGAASAGQGGGVLGGLGQLGSTISNLGNLLNGSSISAQLSGGFLRSADWLATSSNNTLAGMGEWMQGNQWLGSAMGALGNGFAGYGISKTLSGGYSTGLPVNEIAAIASMIPGIGPIAGVVGGLVNRAFGRKLKDTGLEGTFSGMDGLSANTYQFYKGGWLRSDKTKRSALDEDLRSGLAGQYAAMTSGNAAMAQALGLSTDGLAAFRSSFKFSTNGMSEEQVSQRLAEEFAKMADAQALLLMGTEDYVREGETAAATLTRLSTSLTSVNQVLDTLGLQAYATSLAGGDMASSLADLFGGLEAFSQASTTYYEAFYTEAERTATTTRQLTAALGQLGLQLPDTRDAYRALVDAQDLTTEAGRSTYAALLQLAPAFASISTSADDLGRALEQAGNSIADEVRRLRGLTTTASADQGLAALQARFATATAAARAGSSSALEELPAISQALEEAAALQAKTAAELALLRGQTAASLQATLGTLGLTVPAFEVGTNYVPRTMLAQVHEGEAIVPKAYNPAAGGAAAGSDDLARRVDALVTELQGLRAEVRSGVTHSAKTARILDRVARDGNAFVTVAEA